MLLLTLLACPAEQLGVALPQGGKAALAMEDFQRDVNLLTQSERRSGMPGFQLGREELQTRLVQMHLLPAFGKSYRGPATETEVNICGERTGASGQAVVIAALDQGKGAYQSAAPLAAMISLAKTYDSPQPPPYTLLFCRIPGADRSAWTQSPALPMDQTRAIFWLHDMGEGTLVLKREEGVPVQFDVHGATHDWFGSDQDSPDRMHYPTLITQTSTLRDAVDQVMED
jgi:hypothetical protein